MADSGRRRFLRATLSLILISPVLTGGAGAMLADPIDITVYKDPSCGCCAKWVEHLQAHSFAVAVHETADMAAIKQQFQVPEALQACHTAIIDGYVIEGHVPADDIRRLLNERPAARGLAVAGMPAGSPGMETDGPAEHYDVMLFPDTGAPQLFNSY